MDEWAGGAEGCDVCHMCGGNLCGFNKFNHQQ